MSRGRACPHQTMKLFISYPSGQRGLAERLTLALEAEGHEVFIDRADLKAGESFHHTLREATAAERPPTARGYWYAAERPSTWRPT